MSRCPLDTDPQSWDLYRATVEAMDGAARMEAAVELSEAVRELRLAGLRARHPELTPAELMIVLIREEYGVDLAAERPPPPDLRSPADGGTVRR